MKKLIFAIAVMAAGAAMAVTIAYQGALKNADGSAVSGGPSLPITFRLYSSATSEDLLWARTVNVLLNDEGLFNVELSDTSGSQPKGYTLTSTLDGVLATYTDSLFIGLDVEGSTGEIRPRQKLLSVPMAAYAQDVSKAKNNFEVAGHANIRNGLGMTGDAAITGNVCVVGMLRVKGKIEGADEGSLSVNSPIEFSENAKLANGVTLSAASNTTVSIESGANLKQDGVVGGIVPRGGIIMWSGKANAIPKGWALCNGETVGGVETPDLRGCFIVGAGKSNKDGDRGTIKDKAGNRIVSTAYAVGNVGGEESHQLSMEEMPAHMHLYPGDEDWQYLFKDGSRFGSWKENPMRYELGRTYMRNDEIGSHPDFDMDGKGNNSLRILETGRTGGDGTKTTTGDKEGEGYAALGHAQPHENRPPYYALCFIIKL